MATIQTQEPQRSDFEDKVIITTIIFSLSIAVLLFLFSHIPGTGTVVATFLGLGLAALVYRFLGGVGETSFQIKAWKIAGTGAFLIGTIWFIDSRLQTENQWDPPRNNTQWFAAGDNGIPLEVRIQGQGAIEKPFADIWAKNQLLMEKTGENFALYAEHDSTVFSHGYVTKENLKALNLSNDFALSVQQYVITDSLIRPYTKFYNLDPIPLYISTGRYGGGFSRYSLHDKKGEELYQGRIRGRGAEIIQIDDAFYFVAVTMVNHQSNDINENYAKFAIAALAINTAIK